VEQLDKITEGATGNKEPLTNLLRQCLVLAHTVKNEKLAAWTQNELNGYDNIDALPSYRKLKIIARGFFVGAFNSQLNDQPLPPGILKKEHRDWARVANLTQPIAAYEDYNKHSGAQIPWPPGITALYQTNFFEGMVLNRAWQEIPSSAFASLLDTVRKRILSLALELKDQLGDVSGQTNQLEPAKVDSSVVYHIYGGNNVIAATAQSIQQAGRDVITTGDIGSLKKALGDFGVEAGDITEIVDALKADGDGARLSLGQKTVGAIKAVAGKLVSAGKSITASAATSIITQMVLQFLGSGSTTAV
jgi:AbiTii